MNPVIIFVRQNHLEDQALKAWLWEWNIPWEEHECVMDSKIQPLVQTVINGKPFTGSFGQQKKHLEKVYGLRRPVLHD